MIGTAWDGRLLHVLRLEADERARFGSTLTPEVVGELARSDALANGEPTRASLDARFLDAWCESASFEATDLLLHSFRIARRRRDLLVGPQHILEALNAHDPAFAIEANAREAVITALGSFPNTSARTSSIEFLITALTWNEGAIDPEQLTELARQAVARLASLGNADDRSYTAALLRVGIDLAGGATDGVQD